MSLLANILITLAAAWLLGRVLGKWATEHNGMRVIASLLLLLTFLLPKLFVVVANAAGVFVLPPLQVLLALASLWLCLECLVLLRHNKRRPNNARRLAKLLRAYAIFLALLLALNPLLLDLADNARNLDGNSNGRSLPRLLTLFAAWHLLPMALAGTLAQWHAARRKLSWRVLLPFAKA